MALSKIVENSIATGAVAASKLKDFTAAVDLNGVELVLDADGNTSITADTNDQIDFKIAGADDFRFTANTFTALAGSGIVVPDGGLTLGSTAVSSTAAELNILDDATVTTAELNLIDGGTARGTTAVADADGLLHNDGGTMRMTSAATFKTYFQEGISTAYDDLTTGDAAVNIATSAGNITIDAQGNNTDIIFKGTDGGADKTFMTIDGSAGGDLFLTGGLIDLKNDGSAVSQIKFYCESSNAHAQTLIGAPHSESATNTLTLPSTGGNSYLLTAASTATLTNKTLTSPVINTGTFGTSILPVSADGTTLGSASKEFSDLFLADGGQILFGEDQEITLTHEHNTGLIIKHNGTGDGAEPSLTFQAGDTDIAANDVLGSIFFQAPGEGAGTDAILIAAGIEAVSEGDFSASNNATKLSFKTAASELASEKMSLSSAGVLTVSGGVVGDVTGDVTGTADVATVATTVTITDNESTDEANAVIFTAGADVDGGNIGLESDGNLTYNPSSGTLTTTVLNFTHAAITGNITTADDTLLQLGAGNDLVLTHDATNSSITNNTGNLNIGSDGLIKLQDAGANETFAIFNDNGAVELYHDNTKKFETIAGGVRIPSGGLLFGSDTATANALDDYEEGTWTPSFAFGGNTANMTFDATTGTYTRIGNLVMISCNIDLGNKGTSTGNASVIGFPFAVNHSGNLAFGATIGYQLYITNSGTLLAMSEAGPSMELSQTDNSGNQTRLTHANFQNNSRAVITMTYQA